jgi:predicted RND superfamily exporter protein
VHKNQLRLLNHRFFVTMLKVQQKAIRSPKLILLGLGMLFLVSLLGLTQLKILLSIDDLIDSDFKTYPGLQKVNSNFKDKNNILLSLESPKPFAPEFLCQVQSWLLHISAKESRLERITSAFGPSKASLDQSRLSFKRLIDVPCSTSAPINQNQVAESIEGIKKSPWGSILATETGYGITINFNIKDTENKKFGTIDVFVLDRLKKSFKENVPTNDITVFWGGVTTYQTYLKDAMDITQALNALMFVIGVLFFRFFFSSWKLGFIFNTTVITSTIIVYGLMGYMGIPIDVLTNATGLILFASCLEDLIFVAYGMAAFKWSFKKSVRRFFLPAFFTSLTTSIGFASLVTSDLGIIRRIGIVVAVGGLLEWVIIFIGLPAIMKLVNPKIDPHLMKIYRPKFRLFEKLTIKPKFLVSCGLIAFVVVSMIGIPRLQVKDTPEDFFKKSHEVNTTTAHFLKTRGWISDVSLLFSQSTTLEQRDQIVSRVNTLPIVKKIEYRRSTLDYLSKEVPEIRSTIETMWEDSQFSERLVSKSGQERAIIYINTMDNQSVSHFRKTLEDICGSLCEFSSSLISYNEFGEKVLGTFFESLFVSLLLVGLVIYFISGNLGPKTIFYLLVSSFWGPLALVATFILLDIPVFFVSSICAAVLVGLAGDNAIQFIFSARKSNINSSVSSLGYASLLTTLGMMSLFSIFLLSPVAPLGKLGLFMLFGILLGYLGDVWLLRGLLKK